LLQYIQVQPQRRRAGAKTSESDLLEVQNSSAPTNGPQIPRPLFFICSLTFGAVQGDFQAHLNKPFFKAINLFHADIQHG